MGEHERRPRIPPREMNHEFDCWKTGGDDTPSTNDCMKSSSAHFGDYADVKSELILTPNQKLNSLSKTKSKNTGKTYPPVIQQRGLLAKFLSKKITLYCIGFLLFFMLIVILTVSLRDDGKNENYVTKDEWGAAPASGSMNKLERAPTLVVIHHTVTESCTAFEDCASTLRSIQKHHMNKTYSDIGYNFMVGGDGRAYEGRGYTTEGAHTLGYNYKTLGLGFIGEFSKEHPFENQLKAAQEFLEKAEKLGYLTKNFKICGGNQLNSNHSPGAKLSEDIKAWPRYTDRPKEWLKESTPKTAPDSKENG